MMKLLRRRRRRRYVCAASSFGGVGKQGRCQCMYVWVGGLVCVGIFFDAVERSLGVVGVAEFADYSCGWWLWWSRMLGGVGASSSWDLLRYGTVRDWLEMEMEDARAESGNWEERGKGSRSGNENALCLMGFSTFSFCGMMIRMCPSLWRVAVRV